MRRKAETAPCPVCGQLLPFYRRARRVYGHQQIYIDRHGDWAKRPCAGGEVIITTREMLALIGASA